MLHTGAALVTVTEAPGMSPDSYKSAEYIELAEQYGAHNYAPLPVVAHRAEGAWIEDVDGKRYLDCLAAYSAVNFGHGNRNPRDLARPARHGDTGEPGVSFGSPR